MVRVAARPPPAPRLPLVPGEEEAAGCRPEDRQARGRGRIQAEAVDVGAKPIRQPRPAPLQTGAVGSSPVERAAAAAWSFRPRDQDVIADGCDAPAGAGVEAVGRARPRGPVVVAHRQPPGAGGVDAPGHVRWARTRWTSAWMSIVGCHVVPPSAERSTPPTWTLTHTLWPAPVIERVSGGPPQGVYQSARPSAAPKPASGCSAASSSRSGRACAVPTSTPAGVAATQVPGGPSRPARRLHAAGCPP